MRGSRWGGPEPARIGLSIRAPRWGAAAWGAIALTAASIALSWWWLAEDHGVPGTEPGATLSDALATHATLAEGDLFGPISASAIHPPLVRIVGAIGMLIGGVNVTAPTIAEVLVFVPLLALGCYGTAKLVAGPRAGLLAVAFALGTPLVVESFHVLMLDAPTGALAALSVWLVLASDRFRRTRVAALAGLAVGLGLLTKQQFVLSTAGLVAVVLLRGGGWRRWRGICAFALGALVVAGPWYLIHVHRLGVTDAVVGAQVPGTRPPRLALSNAGWYLWGALNGELLAPLSAFVAIGVATATVQTLRGRAAPWIPELLGGLLASWVALMATPIHVVRYLLPLIVYLAVLGTVWVVRLGPRPRLIAVAALGLALGASVLGAGFGVGGEVRVALASHMVRNRAVFGIARTRQIVIYTNRIFQLSGPRRGDDLLAMLRSLERHGIQTVSWLPWQEEEYEFDHYGLDILAAMAGMGELPTFDPSSMPPGAALLMRNSVTGSPPCARMAGGHGVWVRVGRALDPRTPDFCPARRGS
jgi:dolichyl-phosphate-mannose-protein mannosyltransferase